MVVPMTDVSNRVQVGVQLHSVADASVATVDVSVEVEVGTSAASGLDKCHSYSRGTVALVRSTHSRS